MFRIWIFLLAALVSAAVPSSFPYWPSQVAGYGIAFYCVIGFVIASTIPIIPLSFTGWGEAALCIAAAIGGFAGSFYMDRWNEKRPVSQDEPEGASAQK